MDFNHPLSKPEAEVVELFLQSKSNKQIALALGISKSTVEFHLRKIYAKYVVSTGKELISNLGKTTGAIVIKPGESTDLSGYPDTTVRPVLCETTLFKR